MHAVVEKEDRRFEWLSGDVYLSPKQNRKLCTREIILQYDMHLGQSTPLQLQKYYHSSAQMSQQEGVELGEWTGTGHKTSTPTTTM